MQMQWSYVWAVVLTGLIVVFLGLAILIAFVSLFGKIFTSKQNKKQSEPVQKEPVTVQAVSTQAIEETNDEDDGEVIAVISAAVMAMSLNDNTTYKVKSIKAVNSNTRSKRPVWATAGLSDNTNPF